MNSEYKLNDLQIVGSALKDYLPRASSTEKMIINVILLELNRMADILVHPKEIEEAPPSTEPITGYRIWSIGEDAVEPYLDDIMYPSLSHGWTPRQVMIAKGTVLDPIFHAGIHAAKFENKDILDKYCPLPGQPTRDYDHRSANNPLQRYIVAGIVALWGDVIEHERGYRGQFAYPQLLYTGGPCHNDSLVRQLAARYGVEVAPHP